ncbi:MAG TPA: D-2-hydroxyacid dehydrogenase [Flavitalea sp.]|nr:D-2-hydroxyacid dehydrogenase [Flavitalea sp.]
MTKDQNSRRKFLATLAATGALATTQFTPLPGFANSSSDEKDNGFKPRNADEPIKIVSTMRLSAAEMEQIRKAGKNIELVVITDSKDTKLFTDAEVWFGYRDGAMFSQAKKLKWVQALGAGVENMPKELVDHPCTLTNMQRIYAPVIAESAIGLLLSLTRGLTQLSIPAFSQKKWIQTPDDLTLEDLYGKTIGIVGMGGIGSETARRLHYGFNMRVLSTDAKPLPRPAFVEELHDPSWLMEMVPQVDVLMSAAPLTPITKGMFNEQVFSKMKPSAYFINVSRGGLVDQDALVKALKEKRIRGAGLDVTTPEPLPPDHPLWSCPNLVITPHNSGEAAIRQTRLIKLIAENVRRYSNGLPLMNVVDKVKGY